VTLQTKFKSKFSPLPIFFAKKGFPVFDETGKNRESRNRVNWHKRRNERSKFAAQKLNNFVSLSNSQSSHHQTTLYTNDFPIKHCKKGLKTSKAVWNLIWKQ